MNRILLYLFQMMVTRTDHPLWSRSYEESGSGSPTSLSSVTTSSTYFSDEDNQLDQENQLEELTNHVEQVSLLGDNIEDPPTNEDPIPLQFPLEYLDQAPDDDDGEVEDQPPELEIPSRSVEAEQYVKANLDGNGYNQLVEENQLAELTTHFEYNPEIGVEDDDDADGEVEDHPVELKIPRRSVDVAQYVKIRPDGHDRPDDGREESLPLQLVACPISAEVESLDSGNYVLVSIAQPNLCGCRWRLDELYLQWYDKMSRLLASLRYLEIILINF